MEKRIMSLRTMENKYLQYFFLWLLLLSVACAAQDRKLNIKSDGHLYFGNMAYSLDSQTRAVFRKMYSESESNVTSEGPMPGEKIISYTKSDKPVFDVHVTDGKIYRVVVYDLGSSLRFLDEEFNADSNVSELMARAGQCDVFQGERPGSYILCEKLPSISFYSDCEAVNISPACKVESILLNAY